MTALELYEPLLLYVCKVNRLVRNGVPLSFGQVRGEVLGLIGDADARAEEDPVLRDHHRALRAPITYFIDDLFAQGRYSFAGRWHENRLGYVKDGLAGDEAFFDYLDEAIRKPPSEGLSQQLLVYYVCLGLGFEGFYFNQPDRLRQYMKALEPAIRHYMVDDSVPRLVPQAYEYTDQRDFVRPPELRKALLLAGVLCLLLAGIPLFLYLGSQIIAKEDAALRQIFESHQGPRPESR
ncbi:MAG TPA: DotU family type IV/VI secretion system protein [Verrucomicrobiales bacterium]|jgi:type VI protein secretion system component VasF|nr:DotU family type IV/VI secretion system protein [Verrucomicrobiales bacterium]